MTSVHHALVYVMVICIFITNPYLFSSIIVWLSGIDYNFWFCCSIDVDKLQKERTFSFVPYKNTVYVCKGKA